MSRLLISSHYSLQQRSRMGVELEIIGEMKDDSLNDQIEDESDFVEVLAPETNRVRADGRLQLS